MFNRFTHRNLSLTALIAAGATLASLLVPVQPSQAQSVGMSRIRDAEIEHTIRDFSTPVWEAAGLAPNSVKIYLLNDPTVNAFVSGGQNIFIHTGLILRTRNPGELIGVVAHETGHIAGGHLARGEEAMKNAYMTGIVTMVLGAAAMIAGGGNAGAAVMAGGQQVAERTYLHFSRTQESQADQAAATFLNRSGESAEGLLSFLKLLGQDQAVLVGHQDPYLLTHPLSEQRVEALEDRVNRSPYKDRPWPPTYVERFRRMQAKLVGFLEPLGAVLRKYPATDQSLPARYARAIAYYRVPELDKALPLMDELLKERPNDPYFHELKGQMLYENGRVAESVPSYQTAVKELPNEPLLRYELGQAQLGTEDPALVKAAILNLEESTRQDPDDPGAWYQLSVGYGRSGNIPMAHLAAAEQALRSGRLKDARMQAERARGQLPFGSPAALRADDIASAARRELQDMQR